MAALLALSFIGSTPVSSLSSHQRSAGAQMCLAQPQRALSLVGSQGAFGIIAVSPGLCAE
ncbi:MAG TPA: hypothetical protein VJ750_10360 [Rhizomicrobium sp.]|nr:hypothetical protein [Rhizomicrobium sp.]